MVADICVGDVGGFGFFDGFDKEEDQREEDDFVGGLQDELEEGLVENFLGCKDADEGYGEEDSGVDSLAGHGAEEVATAPLSESNTAGAIAFRGVGIVGFLLGVFYSYRLYRNMKKGK